MEEPLAELAGYSRAGSQVPDTDLVRLTAAARTAGHRWDAIAAACDNGPGQDIPGVIRQQYWISPAVGPGPLFSATPRAARNLAGREASCYRPLTWPCPGCGNQVTDLAPGGRPARAELGHAAGCTRLARDQGADDALRREWLPRLILYSDDPIGSLQRHWLAGPITDDCPRCGWHGYFHHHLATIDGNWAYTLCDDFPINFACYRRWCCDMRGECWASFGRCIGCLVRWRSRWVGTRSSTSGVTSSSVRARTGSSQVIRSWWTRSTGWTSV
jgi:hypothetical protein